MGGGGKKGGGGGGSTSGLQNLNLPQGLLEGAASTTGLGQYGTSLLNPLAAMTGWASTLATGQQTNVPTPQAFATQQGPAALAHGTGKEWATQFDPTTGLVTFTNPGNPRQTFQSDLRGAEQNFDLPPQVTQQWQADANAYQQYATSAAGGGAYGAGGATPQAAAYAPATSAYLPAAGSIPDFQTWFSQNVGKTVFVNGQPRTVNTDLSPDQALAAYQAGALSWNPPAGAQLSQAYQNIQAQQAATGQMSALQSQAGQFVQSAQAASDKYSGLGDLYNQQAQQLYGVGMDELSAADQAVVKAQAQLDPAWQFLAAQEAQLPGAQQFLTAQEAQLPGAQQFLTSQEAQLPGAQQFLTSQEALTQQLETGPGLFPAQAAMIEQARQSEEAQLASTLGAAGLGRSTQLDQLRGAADLAAAATAGQLQQGNIQTALQGVSGGVNALQAAQAGVQQGVNVVGAAQAGVGQGISALQAAQAGVQEGVNVVGAAQAGVTTALGEQAGAQKTIALSQGQVQAAQNYYNLQQSAAKLALGGQTLEASEQAQLVNELQNITTQSLAMQQQSWAQALAGYGMMGSILGQSAQSYGLSLSAYQSVLQGQTAFAGQQENYMAAQLQAQAQEQQANNSLFGSLGQMLGGSGGSSGGGGLFGAIGGLFGGGAAAAGTGLAAGGAGASAGEIALDVAPLIAAAF